MKYHKRPIWTVLGACLLVFAMTAHAEFQAAIAVRDVTPDPLLPVSGGTGGSEASTVAKGRLNVRALVLADDDTKIAICSTDFLGFPATLGNKVRAKVKGIPAENIIIGATHTHSAPDPYCFPNGDGTSNCDIGYLDEVCDKLADAINEAASALQPVSLKIATGDAKGKIAYNYYAPQLYDPRMSVIQAIAADGRPLATLVNYATHPEVIGAGEGILSPDLVGPMYSRIEELGGGAGIFMNSAQGGMVTADNRVEGGRDERTWEECLRIGNLMADEALRIVSDAPVQEDPDLLCEARTVEFPVTSPLLKAIIEASPMLKDNPTQSSDSLSTQVNVVNLGNAQILTIPGEALPNIGFYLKRNMHGEHNLLFGLTNDAFGYILTKVDFDSFRRYDYISQTSLGEMTGEIYIEEALKFVDSVPKPAKFEAAK